MTLLYAPATLRNRDVILGVLRRVLPAEGLVLELASGSGEHATFFAEALPGLRWQPSDPDPDARRSIAGWTAELGVRTVLPPLAIDARDAVWPLDRADAVVAINVVHISPWEATLGLLAGAARVLSPGGLLYLYGPYRRGGAHTSSSNEEFDASLRERDPRWGVRDLEALTAAAEQAGFAPGEVLAMPANNLSLTFRRA